MHTNAPPQAATRAAALPQLHLLWRQAARDALARAKQAAGAQPAVLVRLVNQPFDRAAAAALGLKLVTLPMAFAGLNERDQVLREAVLRRLAA